MRAVNVKEAGAYKFVSDLAREDIRLVTGAEMVIDFGGSIV